MSLSHWSIVSAALSTIFLMPALVGADEKAPAATAPASAPVKVIIAGDSTVANGKPGHYVGWGQFVPEFFDDGVTFDNRAVSGTGTVWWLNVWPTVLKQKPDYVFIQLGHNDKRPDPKDTSPAAYIPNLRKLVQQAQDAGIKVVLVTPVAVRAFTPKGEFNDVLLEKANAVKELAKSMNVPVVDLHASSVARCKELGRDGCAQLGSGPGDGVHFCPKGARMMAELVAKELPVIVVDFAPHVKKSDDTGH